MRLKPVCAFILLGLSGSAFAATHSHANVQAQLNTMQSQINSMEQVINQNNGMTQTNGGTALQQRVAACPNWYDSIRVSGLVNVDGILASRSIRTLGFEDGVDSGLSGGEFGDHSASDLALDNADLFVDAQVNSWTKAHVGLNYQTVNNTNLTGPTFHPKRIYNTSLILKPYSSDLLDEAYVTFGNFCKNPFYLRVGKQYVNFGNYDRFATVPTFTQLLSQTNETAATLGFVMNSFYGSVYGFRGVPDRTDLSRSTFNVKNWGANLGWGMKSQGSALNLQAGYLNNMVDVDYVSTGLSIVPPSSGSILSGSGYASPVSAVSLDATGSMGMWDAYAHYVTAIDDFSKIDVVSYENHPGFPRTNRGASPSALTVGAGATAQVMNHKTRFGVDYQYSWDAVAVGPFGMPQARLEGTVDMNVSKNVQVGLDVYHDQDYSIGQGGTGRGATTGVAHVGVMFA